METELAEVRDSIAEIPAQYEEEAAAKRGNHLRTPENHQHPSADVTEGRLNTTQKLLLK